MTAPLKFPDANEHPEIQKLRAEDKLQEFMERVTRKKHTHFFYGYADETSISGLCQQSEDDGCEVVTIIPGMAPAPRGVILPPGAPNVITVLKLFVRIARDKFPALQDLCKLRELKK